MNRTLNVILAAGVIALLASCASKKAAVKEQVQEKTSTSAGMEAGVPEHLQELTFVRKVYDTQVYARNIVGRMSFNLKRGDKNISAPGSIHMRKDKVIRLQVFIPLLGSEVGRVEFTPDYVLVVDRIHKEYVKASYDELDFLRDNGLSFYSLQALFWNQLLVPGKQKVSEADLRSFGVAFAQGGETLPVTLANGKMEYRWNADKGSGRIQSVVVTYTSGTRGKSTLTWRYGNFRSVGVKQFPARQEFGFTSEVARKRQQGQVTIDMGEVTTDSDWMEKTEVSGRYRKMEARDILGKLLNM